MGDYNYTMHDAELGSKAENETHGRNVTLSRVPEKGIITYDIPKIDLPQKEAAVCRLLALGRTHKQIAEEFNISPATVDQRKKRAMQRLGITTTAGLIHYAIAAALCDLLEAQ